MGPISEEITGTVRIKNKELAKKVTIVMNEHELSFNMAIQMLLGYAFNQIGRTGKKFKPVVVFTEGE